MTSDFYCDFVLNKKMNVKIEVETENLLAFHHTKPAYPFHVVIVPKKHIASLVSLDDMGLVGEVFKVAKEIIKNKKLNDSNFRIITNGGSFQDSKHLHFHLVSEKGN